MYSLHLALLDFYIMDDIIRNKVFFCFNMTLDFFYNGKEQCDSRPNPNIMLHICTTKSTLCNENSQTRKDSNSLTHTCGTNFLISEAALFPTLRVFRMVFTTNSNHFPKQY
jgi:hypothetical protein